jgi:hypothetical protein
MIEVKEVMYQIRVTFASDYSMVLVCDVANGIVHIGGDGGSVCLPLDSICKMHVDRLLECLENKTECCANCKFWEVDIPEKEKPQYRDGIVVRGFCSNQDVKEGSGFPVPLTAYTYKCKNYTFEEGARPNIGTIKKDLEADNADRKEN